MYNLKPGLIQCGSDYLAVVPDPVRCVQCGICSYHCPIGIDVRRCAWLGEPIKDSHCLTCGECVARCPRGVLRFEKSTMFVESDGSTKYIRQKNTIEGTGDV
jgi:NAD-dependent dihydropyrimidine dehydrogenase PreA subunit